MSVMVNGVMVLCSGKITVGIIDLNLQMYFMNSLIMLWLH